MFPPELVELIVRYGWECLSTSSHRHGYSMACWMLVSREWLSIVIPIFLRDVWATSQPLMIHLLRNGRSPGLVYRLAGITDVRQYLAENCRSLTVSIYEGWTGEYDRQCTELAEYVADPSRERVVQRWLGYEREPYYGVPLQKLRNVILDWLSNITSLHFVLVDCLPTYWYWNVKYDTHEMVNEIKRAWSIHALKRDRITDLHFTFAYTSSLPPLLVSAPRGTLYPPRDRWDLPTFPEFDTVKRLVVRDANADFVAFLTTQFPELECIESTATFGAEDLPPEVAERVGDRMVFRRLAPTTDWGIVGSDLKVRTKEPSPAMATEPPPTPMVDTLPVSQPDAALISRPDVPCVPQTDPPPATSVHVPKEDSITAPEKKKKSSLWSVIKRAFRKSK
ncbi:hypothetical protein FB45DRAFT_877206 [Roridomyces roridus]|uniref:Uncharacterized protein n=1 Tax=Roridomyces roridus TaxID=1738132 RepID=A0AAD7B386_9AGAR|nr:hypothetical protein FB45DRAFT_877206 [Roridomyces roridus]